MLIIIIIEYENWDKKIFFTPEFEKK